MSRSGRQVPRLVLLVDGSPFYVASEVEAFKLGEAVTLFDGMVMTGGWRRARGSVPPSEVREDVPAEERLAALVKVSFADPEPRGRR